VCGLGSPPNTNFVGLSKVCNLQHYVSYPAKEGSCPARCVAPDPRCCFSTTCTSHPAYTQQHHCQQPGAPTPHPLRTSRISLQWMILWREPNNTPYPRGYLHNLNMTSSHIHSLTYTVCLPNANARLTHPLQGSALHPLVRVEQPRPAAQSRPSHASSWQSWRSAALPASSHRRTAGYLSDRCL